jgi:hypothetical protein
MLDPGDLESPPANAIQHRRSAAVASAVTFRSDGSLFTMNAAYGGEADPESRSNSLLAQFGDLGDRSRAPNQRFRFAY